MQRKAALPIGFLVACVLALASSSSAIAGDKPSQQQCIPASVTPARDPDDVIFARARIDMDRKRFEDAAIAFRYLAMHRSDQDIGLRAAPLYIEAANQVGMRLDRKACWDSIARDVPRLRELYCSSSSSSTASTASSSGSTNKDATCLPLDRVQADLDRLEAQKIIEDADKRSLETTITTDPKASASSATMYAAHYEKAATILTSTFRKLCEEPVAKGQSPRALSCDEIAFNAARAFRSAANVTQAIATFRAMIALDAKSPLGFSGRRSGLVGRATLEVGVLYQGIASFEDAAEWYERYATIMSTDSDADRALSDAMYFRLRLGQIDRATADMRLFLKLFGRSAPIMAAQVVLAIAAYHGEKEDWVATRATLEGPPSSMTVFDKAPLDVQTRAHGLLARAGARPKEEWATVRAMWSDPLEARRRIKLAWAGAGEGEVQVTMREWKALIVVTDAYFAAADEKRATTVDTLRYPAYSGPPNDATALATHLRTTVKAWYDQKVAAIEKLAPEYLKVPPQTGSFTENPSSDARARRRIALLWADFADELARVSTPPAWLTDAAAKKDHAAAFAKMRDPIKHGRAKPALEKCLSVTKFLFSESEANSCHTWLSKNFKTEYHAADEIIPSYRDATPNGINGDTNPIRYDGTQVRTMRSKVIVD